MLITSGFHFFRGAAVDGVIFLVVALLLLADGTGLIPPARFRLHLPHGRVLFALAIVLGVPMVLAPRYSATETLILSALGAVILVAVWADPPAEPHSARAAPIRTDGGARNSHAGRRAAVLWIILGLVLCLWELSAYFLGRPSPAAEYNFPPLSDLVGPMLDTLVGRTLLVAAWILGGIALLHRGRSA